MTQQLGRKGSPPTIRHRFVLYYHRIKTALLPCGMRNNECCKHSSEYLEYNDLYYTKQITSVQVQEYTIEL